MKTPPPDLLYTDTVHSPFSVNKLFLAGANCKPSYLVLLFQADQVQPQSPFSSPHNIWRLLFPQPFHRGGPFKLPTTAVRTIRGFVLIGKYRAIACKGRVIYGTVHRTGHTEQLSLNSIIRTRTYVHTLEAHVFSPNLSKSEQVLHREYCTRCSWTWRHLLKLLFIFSTLVSVTYLEHLEYCTSNALPWFLLLQKASFGRPKDHLSLQGDN